MKKVLKIVFKLLLVVVLIAGILFLASKLLEEKIVQKAVSAMNSQLDVPVSIDNIQFSLLSKFPYATLNLVNVTVHSSKQFNQNNFGESFCDTLLHFDNLFLSINLYALMHNQIEFDKVFASNGQINFLVDELGKENFNVLNQNIDTKQPIDTSLANLEFMLEYIQLNNVNIRFINKYKQTGVEIFAPSYSLKGHFYKKEYSAFSKGKLLLNYFEQGKILIKPINPAKINMNVNVTNNKVEFVNSTIESPDYFLTTNGSVLFGNRIQLDLGIVGQSNNLSMILKSLDAEFGNGFESQGQIGVSMRIKGDLDNTQTPAILANFKLVNGSVSNKKLSVNISEIELSGTYSNGKVHNLHSSTFNVDNFKLAMDSSQVSGKIKISNFIKPYFEASINGNFNLNEFNNWIPEASGIKFQGMAQGMISVKGYYNTKAKGFSSNFMSWTKLGSFAIRKGQLSINKPSILANNINASISINNNALVVNQIAGEFQDMIFTGNARIDDFANPIFDSTMAIYTVLNIDAEHFDYDKFKYLFNNDQTTSASREYNFEGQVNCNKVKYEQTIANNFTCSYKFIHNNLYTSNIKFNAFEGTWSGQLNYLTKSAGQTVLQTHTNTSNVNIKTLFRAFNNFGQNYIVADNIDGYVKSDFDLEMVFNNGKVDTSSIELLGHARIDAGKLVNFQPITEVSKFSDIQELKNIEFSKLENDIMISNSTVYIPKMDISSNAFDLAVHGRHTFQGDYEYHLRILMSDFVGGKTKRLAKQQTEFGYVEDDGLGKSTMYLLATSKNGISKVKLDNAAIKGNLKKGVANEKVELKSALQKEFGWFKNDSTLKNIKKKEVKQEFEIEWDEE